MLFNKPDNLKYVDMCKEFDEEFYSGHRDDTKLFKYMYWMYYMFASKAKLFHGPGSLDDYDYYARFAATTIYTRFIRKEREGEKIKSLKNYAERTFYHLRTMYLKDKFNTVVGGGHDDEQADGMDAYMKNAIQPSYSSSLYIDILDELENLPKIFRKIISRTPYRNDKIICKRLYISCMLTFINSITLCKDSMDKLSKKKDKEGGESEKVDNYLFRLLSKEKSKETILWKLDVDEFDDYVKVLVNKARLQINKNIYNVKDAYTLPDDAVDAVMSNLYEEVYGIDTGD